MSRNRRQRLGKGLGALLGEEYLTAAGDGADIRSVRVSHLAPNPFQPRREFRDDELEELKRSIQENGLLQPLVVRPEPNARGERFQLVAGERRLRSVMALGWESVPAVIREVDDRTLLVLALVENIQRESLGPLEEAEGYQVLVEEFSLTQGEVADAVGKSRSSVANALRLLRLPPSVRRLLAGGELSMGHARALLGVEDPGRLAELARRAALEGWSVREVEDRVRRAVSGGGGSAGSRKKSGKHGKADHALAAVEEELRRTLGTRVVVKGGRGGAQGSIRIPFSSAGDLERLFELITGREVGEVVG